MKYQTHISYILSVILAIFVLYSISNITLIWGGEIDSKIIINNIKQKYTNNIVVSLYNTCDYCEIKIYQELYSDNIRYPSEVVKQNNTITIYTTR